MLHRTMFEAFSGGYYVGRLFVEPHGDDRPVIQREQHEQLNRELYADGTGVERLDNPLVMKLGDHHIAVHGDEAVPEGTLALPEGMVDDRRLGNPPSVEAVLLAKADRARQLLRLSGGVLGVGT